MVQNSNIAIASKSQESSINYKFAGRLPQNRQILIHINISTYTVSCLLSTYIVVMWLPPKMALPKPTEIDSDKVTAGHRETAVVKPLGSLDTKGLLQFTVKYQ